MTDNVKKLLEIISTNEELKAKFSSIGKDEIIALAREQGIELTEADFESSNGEVSDDELSAVAGGKWCTCFIGGGGTGEEKDRSKTCACVHAGVGLWKNGSVRCACAGAGAGDGA